MAITVKLFAILRDRAGRSEIVLDLIEGQSAFEAAESIARLHPNLQPLISKIAYAVNEQYVPDTTVLHDGDELALIPPVSGG